MGILLNIILGRYLTISDFTALFLYWAKCERLCAINPSHSQKWQHRRRISADKQVSLFKIAITVQAWNYNASPQQWNFMLLYLSSELCYNYGKLIDNLGEFVSWLRVHALQGNEQTCRRGNYQTCFCHPYQKEVYFKGKHLLSCPFRVVPQREPTLFLTGHSESKQVLLLVSPAKMTESSIKGTNFNPLQPLANQSAKTPAAYLWFSVGFCIIAFSPSITFFLSWWDSMPEMV